MADRRRAIEKLNREISTLEKREAELLAGLRKLIGNFCVVMMIMMKIPI